MLLLYSIWLFSFIPGITLAQNDEFPGKIDCYSWSGATFSNNTQCPGSRVCCQTADYCNSNRFCLQNNQIIIPTCAVFPWDDTCSRICQYDPGTGFLPRAVECSDGSFCCDNDPKCCAEDRGIVLNGLGAIVSTHSGSTTSSSTSATGTGTSSAENSLASTTSSANPTTSSISSAPTSSGTSSPNDSGVIPSSSGGLSTGAKAGIGIAVAAVVLIIITLSVLLMRSRRRARRTSQSLHLTGVGMAAPTSSIFSSPQHPSMYSDRTSNPSELGGTARYQDAPKIHELPDQRNSRI